MSITMSELKAVGSATMPDDDTTQQIGGAKDETKKISFYDFNGSAQVVSSAAGDTTQSVTMYYRDSAGAKQSEAKTLSGQTPVAFTAAPERLLKAIKAATCAGWVALEAATAERTGTAQAGGANTITLDTGASGTDDFYAGMVVRLTAGTGVYQIQEIIAYNGTTKVATVNWPWATQPDNTSVFRVAKGMVFDKNPTEVMTVRRLFYDSSANTSGGATKEVHDKFFMGNENATLALTNAVVAEYSDPSGLVTFGLAATKDDSGTNGAGNTRLVAPAGITFDNTNKNVPTGQLATNEYIGVWGKLTLVGGQAANKTQWVPQLTGNTT